MEAVDLLLTAVTDHGARFRVEGDRVKVSGPAPLPRDLFAELKSHKPELLPLLRCLSPDDFADRELMTPAGLAALARVVQARQMRESAKVPEGWTQPAECRHCGPVLLWPGSPAHVEGCPWCFNRLAGKPLPETFSQLKRECAKGCK